VNIPEKAMEGSTLDSKLTCPLCKGGMHTNAREYAVDELFDLWKPMKFSPSTIAEHRCQNTYTRLYTCRDCRLDIFLPQIIGTSTFYAELQANPEAPYYEEDKWDFHEALKDVAGCSKIMELGCGVGNFLAKAMPLVPEVYGTESNILARQSAQSRGLKVFDPADDQISGHGRFDAAFSFHVLEHIADPIGFVKTMISLVHSGGKIGLSVPNQDGPIRYIDPCIMNMPPHHATRWRLKAFQVLARELGLVIERVAYEPLLLQNHSYYSFFWLNKRFPGDSRSAVYLRTVLSKSMHVLFGFLMKKGWKYLPLLRGQSIYVLFSKP
jgi:SAM-dependent methyltransferase